MLMRRIIKGPQIHFWVSEKVVSPEEPDSPCCPKGKGEDTKNIQPTRQSTKVQPLPRCSHVEIF